MECHAMSCHAIPWNPIESNRIVGVDTPHTGWAGFDWVTQSLHRTSSHIIASHRITTQRGVFGIFLLDPAHGTARHDTTRHVREMRSNAMQCDAMRCDAMRCNARDAMGGLFVCLFVCLRAGGIVVVVDPRKTVSRVAARCGSLFALLLFA
eukprot:jgi/Psemu1/316163/fgenesh1_kg.2892_\